jgi:hypothetical protein
VQHPDIYYDTLNQMTIQVRSQDQLNVHDRKFCMYATMTSTIDTYIYLKTMLPRRDEVYWKST